MLSLLQDQVMREVFSSEVVERRGSSHRRRERFRFAAVISLFMVMFCWLLLSRGGGDL